MKNTEKKPFKSPHTGSEFDSADALKSIQDIIRELEFNRDEKLVQHDSDTLRVQLATFNAVLDALYLWFIHEGGDEHFSSDTHFAIQESWRELKKSIDIRTGVYDKVSRIALHGSEDPFEK